jgi:hypothetical protein
VKTFFRSLWEHEQLVAFLLRFYKKGKIDHEHEERTTVKTIALGKVGMHEILTDFS